jgi:predicted acyltransferase
MFLDTIHGVINRRVFLNYRINPEVLGRLLPPPFKPKLYAGHGVGGVCMTDDRRARFACAWSPFWGTLRPMTATAAAPARSSDRIMSVDALRGLVMFTMIFVNDLAGAPDRIVPPWMKHFHGKSGMTFVDLVFPAFLFIVGMSVPFGLGARRTRGDSFWNMMFHIAARTLALLAIGIMMVNESPDSEIMGWSAALWSTLMFLCAILAFCRICPRSAVGDEAKLRTWRRASVALRVVGGVGLVWLAFAFRGENGRRIIAGSPFSIHTEWYGILGLIGWAYLVSSIVYLVFHDNRTALLGCGVLLMCLYPAARNGAFDHFWLAHYVGIGETLGSQASLTTAGMLLAAILVGPDMITVRARTRFTLLFVAGFAAAALLLNPLYGINKNNATPSWCLWSCAITAVFWLVFYWISEVHPVGFVTKPLSVAGQNVLLAYLLSEMLPSAINVLHLGDWYGRVAETNLTFAIARSAICAAVILCATAQLNRVGFRLKL